MKQMKQETTTQDIWLAAFACQHGHEIMDLRNLGDRKLFVFEDSDAFEDLKRDYYWHKATVDPLKLKKSLQKLKALSIGGEVYG